MLAGSIPRGPFGKDVEFAEVVSTDSPVLFSDNVRKQVAFRHSAVSNVRIEYKHSMFAVVYDVVDFPPPKTSRDKTDVVLEDP